MGFMDKLKGISQGTARINIGMCLSELSRMADGEYNSEDKLRKQIQRTFTQIKDFINTFEAGSHDYHPQVQAMVVEGLTTAKTHRAKEAILAVAQLYETQIPVELRTDLGS